METTTWDAGWTAVNKMGTASKLVRFGAMGAALYVGNRASLARIQSVAGEIQFAMIALSAVKEGSDFAAGQGEWGKPSRSPCTNVWDSGRLISMLATATIWLNLRANVLPTRWSNFIEHGIFIGYAAGSMALFAEPATEDPKNYKNLTGATINLLYALSETAVSVNEAHSVAARATIGVLSASWSLGKDYVWSGV